VHCKSSEWTDELLWEDFFAVLDNKERSVVVCLRNSTSKIGEIGKELGYANHSPISKVLDRIRRKAAAYLGLD
jgi:hypothetical protein